MCNCDADVEITNCYRLYSILQNSSEDQLLTVLLHSSHAFLNVNKEIIRLNINLLKVSERFAQSFFCETIFVFAFSIYLFYFSIYLLHLFVQG